VTLGRESMPWPPDLWSRLDQAVRDEVRRTAVATRFLPLLDGAATAATVPADRIDTPTMTVDPAAVVPVVELSLGFGLTQQQVDDESALGTGLSLATRAGNLVAQVEDLLIFQGDRSALPGPLAGVQVRGTAGAGLLASAPAELDVTPTSEAPLTYGEHTFNAVVQAIALLRAAGQAGPYALALSSAVYADTFVPISGTTVLPADQIKPLVNRGLVDTGGLPAGHGLIASLGGNTLDLVITVEPTSMFVQVDEKGIYQFRVFERWALRIKDPGALVRLVFKA